MLTTRHHLSTIWESRRGRESSVVPFTKNWNAASSCQHSWKNKTPAMNHHFEKVEPKQFRWFLSKYIHCSTVSNYCVVPLTCSLASYKPNVWTHIFYQFSIWHVSLFTVYWYVSLTMLVIKCWFCVEADVTTCQLEKEEDTCTEKVFVASFSFS